MEVEPHIAERLLNHSMGAIGNQADSIVSAVAEVYILAKYMPKMRDARCQRTSVSGSKIVTTFRIEGSQRHI